MKDQLTAMTSSIVLRQKSCIENNEKHEEKNKIGHVFNNIREKDAG